MTAVQVMLETTIEQILFRNNAILVELLTILQRNDLKGQEMTSKKLVRMVIQIEKELKVHLANGLEVDMYMI